MINKKDFRLLLDVSSLPESGTTIFHHWVACDDLEKIQKLLDETNTSDFLRCTDFEGNSLLHYAAYYNAKNTCQFIMDNFTTFNLIDDIFLNYNSITPVHIASQNNNTEMLKILSKRPSLFAKLSMMNWSPLHYAIFYGNTESVQYLLENELCSTDELILGPESTTDYFYDKRLKYCSPYDLAVLSKQYEISNLLYENGAYPSLHSSVITNNLQALTYHVMSKDSQYFGEISTIGGISKYTALHLAALSGNYQACHFLIINGASVSTKDKNGFTPLQLAIFSSSVPTIQVLMIHYGEKDLTQATFLATDLGNEQSALVLIESGISPNAINDDGDSLLIRLIKRKLVKVAEALLKLHPDVNYKDSRQATALHYAAAAIGSKDLIEKLIDSGASLNDLDLMGQPPVVYALLANNPELIPLLDNNKLDAPCKYGMSPLLINLCFDISSKLLPTSETFKLLYDIDLEMLVNLPSSFNIGKIKIKTPTKEIESPNLELYDVKITFGLLYVSKRNFPELFLKQVSFFHIVMFFGLKSTQISSFMNHHELINAEDYYHRNPLHYSALLDLPLFAEMFIKSNINLTKTDVHGNSFYHFIRSDSMLSVIILMLKSLLSETFCYVNDHGENIFHSLCRNGCSQILEYIIKKLNAKNIKLLDTASKEGKKPIDLAIENKKPDCMNVLHSCGIENKLCIAIQNNDFELVKTLVDLGFPVNSFDKNLSTPLHYAAHLGNVEIIKYLLQHNAKIDSKNKLRRRPIHEAAEYNNLEAIKILSEVYITLNENDHPMNLSTDIDCQLYLFHSWKRMYFTDSIVKSTQAFEKYYKKVFTKKFIRYAFKKISVDYDFMQELYSKFLLISYLYSKTKKDQDGININYSVSIHHILQIFNALDVTKFCEGILDSISLLLNATTQSDDFKDNQVLCICLYILQWVVTEYKLMVCLKDHCRPEIDKFDFILDHMSEQVIKINETHDKINISIFTSILPQIEPATYYDYGDFFCSSTAVVSDIHSSPMIVFDDQMYFILQSFFGNDYDPPRILPFSENQTVNIILFSKRIVIIYDNSQKAFVLPNKLVFTHLNDNNGTDLLMITPIGSFNVDFKYSGKSTKTINNSIRNSFNMYLYLKIFESVYSAGSLLFQTEKSKMFRCLAIFNSDYSIVNIHSLIVHAGKSTECYDICKSQIHDEMGIQVKTFVLLTQELTCESNDLILI